LVYTKKKKWNLFSLLSFQGIRTRIDTLMAIQKKQTSSGFSRVFEGFGASARLRDEKARLEAFLSAVPGEYCGWGSDRSVAYSKGFCDLLGAQFIQKISDIQNCLNAEDSLALEGLYNRLVDDGLPFSINVHNRAGTKNLKISGTRGADLENQDYFHILWLENLSEPQTLSDEDESYDPMGDIDGFQNALDALPHPVWIRDSMQRILWCNVAYAKIVESPPSEIIAQQKEIISKTRKRKPSEKDILFGTELARAALEKGATQTVQLHEVLGGRRLLVKISEMPVRSENITVGMVEDITEEERVQSEVKNNETAMRALLEQLRSAISIYNTDQVLEFYNASFAQLWGLEEGWLNTKPRLGDIMEKLRETRRLPEQADFKTYKKSWIDMFTTLIEPHEDMLYLPDGSAFRMLVVPHKLGGLMMTFEDVTSRLELESSYNTLIAVQKETLDNLAESVAVYGSDGRLKLWNPSFARLWSFDPETLEGEPHVTRIVDKVSGFFNETDWIEIKERMISLGLERSMNEGRLERTDSVLIDYATVPLPDGGVLITYTNVTDTVRVENALREKNIALEAAEQLKLDFLANVSYQLRTPLNAIMGFNEMLTREFFGPLNAKQKEYTGDIHGASERLLNLINDILDLSTIEAGQMKLDITETSIKPVMDSILDLVTEWARKQGIEVTLQCAANIGKADIDESRIKQAIINLVRNAITYTPEGGKIELKAVRLKDEIKITVQDNGSGIEEEDQVRVLEPFERVEGEKSGRGAGLGLTLVRNIVSLHNGVFDLASSPAEGTCVTITLPKEYIALSES
tara:strand:+ start:645 stop:3056 length:2412 start_codon:yes stop_codon:yes gene_type:complete